MAPGEITNEDLDTFSKLVGRLRDLPADDPTRLRAEQVAASFTRDGRRSRRKERHLEKVGADARLVESTSLGAVDRREDVPLDIAPAFPQGTTIGWFTRARYCYVCKKPYRQAHSFYHWLCLGCAQENIARRAASTDLTGRRALLTGGRVKIGFQLALMLLRDGVELIVTSRFPQDTARRFLAAPGSDAWMDRLTIVGIDLRDPRQVIGLCDELRAQGKPLDILINNAAQTLRRPPESYALLAAGERRTSSTDVAVLHAPGFVPLLTPSAIWPAAELTGSSSPTPIADVRSILSATNVDEAGLLPDGAAENSWSARLGSLDPAEILETQLVNALAPALLCDRLLPLMMDSPFPRRYIINVTAVEGRFTVRNKTSRHPHTNMAKAALNMLTRTSAADLVDQGIYMCAVDTGWITDENPAPKKARMADSGFRTPLDVVDGAARVYHPIVSGEAGDPLSGVFLKDYRESAW